MQPTVWKLERFVYEIISDVSSAKFNSIRHAVTFVLTLVTEKHWLRPRHFSTTEPRRHTIELYASAIKAFTHLYTHDLDL